MSTVGARDVVSGPALQDSVWRAPLVPAALAFSAGILLDRWLFLPLTGSLFAAVVMLAAWGATGLGRSSGLPLVYLALATAALGAGYHHFRRDVFPSDDIGFIADEVPRAVQLRGVLDEEPLARWHPQHDPLRPRRPDSAPVSTVSVLKVTECRLGGEWVPASGRAQLLVAAELKGLHEGDAVEVAGRLAAPEGPANPGERDHAAELRDRGIRAVVRVESADGVTRLEPGGPWSGGAWRARIRGWGAGKLREAMPEGQSGLAAALLLGDGSLLERREWEQYIRTGVIHVLVVSGQHLVVLAAFVFGSLWLFQVPRRRAALGVVLVSWAYAFVVGLGPSVVRAAITVTVFAGGRLLRRPVITANTFALAWLVVMACDPTDIANTGCLLSFLCVAALCWNQGREQAKRDEIDPLERLLEQARPAWQRALLGLGRWVLGSYLVTLGLWLVVTPLVAARTHFIPLAGLLIGPPVIGLTCVALVTGFLFLLLSAVLGPVALPLGWLTGPLLAGCDALVDLGDGLSIRHGYVSDVPLWWLCGFYLMLCVGLLLERSRRHWRWAVLAGAAWLCVGLLSGAARFRPDELRVTFLSVGHGGCTVLETPDGRTLLYDAGSMRGPDVGRYQIAPYLWNRGIRRVDEIFLSHADLDHFNGLRDLMERFPVGRITCTPTFGDKNNAAVRHILGAIERHGVEMRVVQQGDRLTAGEVVIDVLHPPAEGPAGAENVRSMVLLVRHGRHRILLTGDLEREGLEQFFTLPPPRVDVLMAPHHGSRWLRENAESGVTELVGRTAPQVVVSSQARPILRPGSEKLYSRGGARFLATWEHGAVTVRSHASGMVVETFRTKERFVVRAGQSLRSDGGPPR